MNLAADGIITHSYFSCTRLLHETCSRKLMFPPGGGLILDVPLCEAENFDLCILGLLFSDIWTQEKSSLGK